VYAADLSLSIRLEVCRCISDRFEVGTVISRNRCISEEIISNLRDADIPIKMPYRVLLVIDGFNQAYLGIRQVCGHVLIQGIAPELAVDTFNVEQNDQSSISEPRPSVGSHIRSRRLRSSRGLPGYRNVHRCISIQRQVRRSLISVSRTIAPTASQRWRCEELFFKSTTFSAWISRGCSATIPFRRDLVLQDLVLADIEDLHVHVFGLSAEEGVGQIP